MCVYKYIYILNLEESHTKFMLVYWKSCLFWYAIIDYQNIKRSAKAMYVTVHTHNVLQVIMNDQCNQIISKEKSKKHWTH